MSAKTASTIAVSCSCVAIIWLIRSPARRRPAGRRARSRTKSGSSASASSRQRREGTSRKRHQPQGREYRSAVQCRGGAARSGVGERFLIALTRPEVLPNWLGQLDLLNQERRSVPSSARPRHVLPVRPRNVPDDGRDGACHRLIVKNSGKGEARAQCADRTRRQTDCLFNPRGFTLEDGCHPLRIDIES